MIIQTIKKFFIKISMNEQVGLFIFSFILAGLVVAGYMYYKKNTLPKESVSTQEVKKGDLFEDDKLRISDPQLWLKKKLESKNLISQTCEIDEQNKLIKLTWYVNLQNSYSYNEDIKFDLSIIIVTVNQNFPSYNLFAIGRASQPDSYGNISELSIVEAYFSGEVISKINLYNINNVKFRQIADKWWTLLTYKE